MLPSRVTLSIKSFSIFVILVILQKWVIKLKSELNHSQTIMHCKWFKLNPGRKRSRIFSTLDHSSLPFLWSFSYVFFFFFFYKLKSVAKFMVLFLSACNCYVSQIVEGFQSWYWTKIKNFFHKLIYNFELPKCPMETLLDPPYRIIIKDLGPLVCFLLNHR